MACLTVAMFSAVALMSRAMIFLVPEVEVCAMLGEDGFMRRGRLPASREAGFGIGIVGVVWMLLRFLRMVRSVVVPLVGGKVVRCG